MLFKYKYHSNVYTRKENGVTCLRLDADKLEKWMHQNGAIFTGDYIEGSLLDNFVISTKRGYAAVYEHFVTTWTSDYYIEFQPGAAQDVFRRWYEFEDKAEAEQC
jgi:hypothetical protein